MDTTRLRADGHAFATVHFHFADAQPEGAQLELQLSKHGSFSPDSKVREISVPIVNQIAEVQVYAPGRPGAGILQADGFRQRFEFTPVSFGQSLLYEWAPTLGISLVIALFLRSFVVASYYIPSGSMEGTLLKHDLLIADKLTYKLLHQGPKRGDVMIFQYPQNPKQDYIKRTIGLPGDTIEVRDGVVYVNDVALDEPYIKEQPIQDYGPVTVPDGRYFMMGDNRNHSSDSRVWGFVDAKLFEGRALFVFFPFSRAKLIQNELLAQDKVIPAGSAMAAEPSHGGEAEDAEAAAAADESN
ncbi:signal peptidase I [bacterium]|nr:signal peptidase I [bacterium]